MEVPQGPQLAALLPMNVMAPYEEALFSHIVKTRIVVYTEESRYVHETDPTSLIEFELPLLFL